jgi:hypothetical protein
MKVVEDVNTFLQLFVSPYIERSSVPVGIYLQKQSILVFASLPILLVVMEWPRFPW